MKNIRKLITSTLFEIIAFFLERMTLYYKHMEDDNMSVNNSENEDDKETFSPLQLLNLRKDFGSDSNDCR